MLQPHDVSEGAALAAALHLARLAREAVPMKPGPQPWNQVSGSADEQIRRASEPRPDPAREALREWVEEIVRDVMAEELPAALAALTKGRRTA